jgi:hypothetical protein
MQSDHSKEKTPHLEVFFPAPKGAKAYNRVGVESALITIHFLL